MYCRVRRSLPSGSAVKFECCWTPAATGRWATCKAMAVPAPASTTPSLASCTPVRGGLGLRMATVLLSLLLQYVFGRHVGAWLPPGIGAHGINGTNQHHQPGENDPSER